MKNFKQFLEAMSPEENQFSKNESWRSLVGGALSAVGTLANPTPAYAADKPAMTQNFADETVLDDSPRKPRASIVNGKLVIKFISAKSDNSNTTKIIADKYLKIAEEKFGVKSIELTERTKNDNTWNYTYSIKK